MDRKLAKKAKKEIKRFWSTAFFAVVALVAGAVLQLNGFIHQNSLLNDSKKQVARLSVENDNFEATLSQSNSLDNFSRYMSSQLENYEKVDVASIKYVRASASQLARR